MRVGHVRRSLGPALLLTTASLLSGTSAAAADAPACSGSMSALYQRVNPSTDANLLTRSSAEATSAGTQYGFTSDQGVVARVETSPGPDLEPVWRLYRSGDFAWASDGPQLAGLLADGYQRQFVEFYAADAPATCLVPYLQLERDGKHRVARASARADLVQDGWTSAGPAFYAAPVDARPEPEDDARFSVAVLPDTQNEMQPSGKSMFRDRATWLAREKDDLDLRYAFQVGDLVNWGNVDRAQFAKASADIRPLEAALPWAGAIGNHDTAAVCAGGSACPGANTSETVRDTEAYNAAFPVSRFENIRGTFEPGKVDNAYQTFSAGGVDWLVLSLELWPRASAVAWATSVVASHPGDNVIVLTHAYLEADGSIGSGNGGYGATSPQYLYDNLIKVYPNIKMVLSGHVGQAAERTDVGVNGNKILSLLQTFHSTTNPVRIVEIDTAAGSVTSSVYAPYTDTAFRQYATSTTGLRFVR